MKKLSIIFFLLIISLFFSCQEKKKEIVHDGYTINGITALNENKIIYLVNKENIIVDSSAINKKAFHLKGKISAPENYYFKFKNDSEQHPIILENENFIVAINIDETQVFGGSLNAKLRSYTNSISKLDKEKKKKLTLEFINENTNNLLSTKIVLENKNLSLKELLQIQNASKDVENNSFKFVLNSRIEDLQKIEEEKLAKEKAALALKKAYRKPAILFSGEGLEGKDISLKNVIKGKKAVLIDFWASWCAPCRMMTPAIKRLHTKYKDKGFTILTVSEDKDKASWKKGITEDKMLSWNHIYDDFSRISSMHNIKAIPYMILIDGKGRVIKENITYTQLTNELKKICK